MKYNNLTIKADRYDRGKFEIQVTDSPVGTTMPEAVLLDAEKYGVLKKLIDSIERRKLSTNDMFHVGAVLKSMLFQGDVLKAFELSRVAVAGKGEGLCVRLELNDPNIAMLPWEYVHVPRTRQGLSTTDFVALDPVTPIVRYESEALKATLGSVAIEGEGPLKVLLALAEPDGMGGLALYSELEAIKKTVEQRGQGRIEIIIEEHLTAKKLRAYCSQKLHLFYFYGHGTYWPESRVAEGLLLSKSNLSANERWAGYIALEQEPDEEGKIAKHWFQADDLGMSLRDAGAKVAIFCSCSTAKRDAKDQNVWGSMAPQLIATGLPAVVGMQYKLSNLAGVEFAVSFFESLLAGFPLEHAVTRGRIAISSLKSVIVAEEEEAPAAAQATTASTQEATAAAQETTALQAAPAPAQEATTAQEATAQATTAVPQEAAPKATEDTTEGRAADLGDEGPDLGAGGGGKKAAAGDILYYERDWGLPVLYMRTKEGVLFPESAQDPARKQERDKLEKEFEQQVAEVKKEKDYEQHLAELKLILKAAQQPTSKTEITETISADNASISIGSIGGDQKGVIAVVAKDVTITVGGEETPADKEPTFDEYKQLLAELQAEIGALLDQRALLEKVDEYYPGDVEEAKDKVKRAADKATPKMEERDAKRVKGWLEKDAKALLSDILEDAKNVGDDAAPLVEKLTPLVERFGVAVLWTDKV